MDAGHRPPSGTSSQSAKSSPTSQMLLDVVGDGWCLRSGEVKSVAARGNRLETVFCTFATQGFKDSRTVRPTLLILAPLIANLRYRPQNGRAGNLRSHARTIYSHAGHLQPYLTGVL